MKKVLIEISDEAHTELLKIQADRKINKKERATLRDVASDVLEECLLGKKGAKEENPGK
ncbi:hypothetical protein [Pontibacter beigongshangensis]|uniref:hypothetical protein n=1 Tax=Pontibacter beigongshangensis TaxID=2574733 RepID=UPI00164FD22E|nr:hypothetical protein [Pontibacter beigongshangensis]